MATRRYKLSPGAGEFSIVEEAGAATNSDAVEVTVDLATTRVHTEASTRQINKQEVIEILEKVINHLVKHNWPPA